MESGTRAKNFPHGGFERGAVSRTENVAPVLRQELIIYPIHGHGDVAATVHVGEQLALIVDNKTFGLSAVDQ